jgi:hypothetical protein
VKADRNEWEGGEGESVGEDRIGMGSLAAEEG